MTRNRPKIQSAAVLILTVLCLFLGCSKEEPLKIGFIGGLSGRVADLGISGRNGVILAAEQQNSQGGINGRPVQIIAVDDQQNEESAVREFTSLVDQGVVAVIGHMTSSMSVITVPLANRHHLVLLSPTTTTTELKDLDDYFFRVCATTDLYGAEMAKYFSTALGLKKVTTVYDLGNREYTQSWISHFSREFERLGGQVIKEVTFTSGAQTHFTDIAQQALHPESEGIIISAGSLDAASICQQIRKLNSSILIGTSEWAATEKLIELGGSAVENIVVSQFFNRYSTAPGYLQFRKDFKARFRVEPGFAAVASFDAANVIFDALAMKREEQDLKEVLLSIATFEGVQGKISLNRFGDSDRTTYLSIIRNGKFEPMEPGQAP